MVAVLKFWAPYEATAALLLEGAELRFHEALPALVSREVLRNGRAGGAAGGRGSLSSCFRRATGSDRGGSGVAGGFAAGSEVDFVGCVFGVTRLERSRPSSSPLCPPREEEVFATASSILHEEEPAAASLVPSLMPPDPTNIALGACCAIVNACVGGNNGGCADSHRCSSHSLSVRGAPPAPPPPCGIRCAETPAVAWSSMTAVGGSGSSPPPPKIRWRAGGTLVAAAPCAATVGRERRGAMHDPARAAAPGASAGEEEPAMRHSCRSSLVVSACGDRGGGNGSGYSAAAAAAAAAATAAAAAAAAAADTTAGAVPGLDAGRTADAEAGQRGAPDSVAAAGEPHEATLVTRSRPVTGSALGTILRVALGDDAWLSAGRGNLAADGPQKEENEDGEGRGSGFSRGEKTLEIEPDASGDTARSLVARATTVLRHDDAVRGEDGGAADDARHEQGDTGASTSPDRVSAEWHGDQQQRQQPPPPSSTPPPRETAAVETLVSAVCRVARRERQRCRHRPAGSCGNEVGASSPALAGQRLAAMAITSGGRAGPSSGATGSRGGGRTAADAAVGATDGAGGSIKASPLPPRPSAGSRVCSAAACNGGAGAPGAGGATGGEAEARASPTTTAPFDGKIGGDAHRGGTAGGGGTTESMLRDVATACGGMQLAFSLSRSFSSVLRYEVEVVEEVALVDVTRSAGRLLEDLSASHEPPT
eukprot:g3384.t1